MLEFLISICSMNLLNTVTHRLAYDTNILTIYYKKLVCWLIMLINIIITLIIIMMMIMKMVMRTMMITVMVVMMMMMMMMMMMIMTYATYFPL